MRRIVLAFLLAALVAAGCGGDAETEPTAASTGSGGDEQHVHGLAVDPADDALLVATHAGLFRVQDGEARPERVSREAQDFMGFTIAPGGEYLGSGHPGVGQQGPPALGLIRSTDKGRTWTPVSLVGDADFHVLRVAGDRLYGALAGTGVIMVSDDRGASWSERRAPADVIDLAVHPERPDEILVAGEAGIARSTDAAKSWRYQSTGMTGLLAWPEPDRLLLADAAGTLHTSGDAGTTWTEAGSFGGQPAALHVDGRDVYVALVDGTVKHSPDGGRTWRVRVNL